MRRAEPGDADGVLALMEGLTRPAVADDPAPQREVFLTHLDREDAAIFVAEAGGELVGAVSLWIQPRLNWTTPQGWIPDLYVDPAFRRRGAARALLDACAELCRERDCHVLVLESGHHRAEAHRLYESYGFEHYARAYALKL
ncbi:MAG TPA: GNAT family N-acetyltransferase [Gaiellaceae bacterium]|nr:GNAT family N-acetyltransferase [Gaiellaceae bacterium]